MKWKKRIDKRLTVVDIAGKLPGKTHLTIERFGKVIFDGESGSLVYEELSAIKNLEVWKIQLSRGKITLIAENTFYEQISDKPGKIASISFWASVAAFIVNLAVLVMQIVLLS